MLHASTMKLDGFTMFQNHHFQYLSIGKSSIPMILYILHSYVSLLEGIKIIKEEHGDFFAISERNGSDDAWGWSGTSGTLDPPICSDLMGFYGDSMGY